MRAFSVKAGSVKAGSVKAALAAAALIAFGAAATISAHPGPGQHRDRDSIVVRGQGGMPLAANNDSNHFWLDYTTDISEARRELRSDLRRATDEEDRRDAYAEYRHELADAKKDYVKEMTERGFRVASFRQNRLIYARR